MNNECERTEQWLEQDPEGALPAALVSHAADCETCLRRLMIDRDLRERLGRGAALEPAHRAALVAQVAAAKAPAGRRGVRILRWSWVPVAAAAAAAILFVVFTPPPVHREPIAPSDILTDLMGPLADMKMPTAEAPAAPAKANDALPIGDVLSAFWGDLEGPLSVTLGAMEAPRAVASREVAGEKSPNAIAPAKEKVR